MASDFQEVAIGELQFLRDAYGFELVASDEHHVRLESDKLSTDVWFDPRGEVVLTVQRLGVKPGYGRVEYVGMLGTADMPSLIRALARKLRANNQALAADDVYFGDLEVDQRRASREWTEYYSRKRATRPREAKFE